MRKGYADVPDPDQQKMLSVINDPVSFIKMEAMCDAGLPAVQGISQDLLLAVGPLMLGDRYKQCAGTLVKDLLVEEKGFTQGKEAKCRKNPVFKNGTKYEAPPRVVHLV